MSDALPGDPLTAHPFRFADWPKGIVHPDEYDGSESLLLSWDLGVVDEKAKKRAIKAWCDVLPRCGNLRRLFIWSHVTQPLFDAACGVHELRALGIKWSNVKRLDAIAALAQLLDLKIGSSTKVESLAPLAQLASLRLLDLENFKSITDFSPLVQLKSLKVLAVTGSMWTRQAIGSLEPFAQMTWLKALMLDTSSVESLRPLARLTGLAELGVGGRLPMEEYAWLSARLPNTRCPWFAPWQDLAGSGIGRCPQCGTESRVMLTGRGARTLCRQCDRDAVALHVGRFEDAVARAKRE